MTQNPFFHDNITLQNICVIRGKSMYLQKSDHIFISVRAGKHYLLEEMQKWKALGHLFIIANCHLTELI